ncbi:MAG: chromosomal replication initiator protein DnaA [Zoogloeaceae bacterium]|jgi:chromosomal replication initiator protein|nr:chromosomal replication initiator protein DnaA [Zoogloeaceae bacterium]
MSAFWNFCLQRCRQYLPPQHVDNWIRPLVLTGSAEEGFCLQAKNLHIKNTVREKYLAQIHMYANEFFGKPVRITLKCGKNNGACVGEEAPPPLSAATRKKLPGNGQTLQQEPALRSSDKKTRLNLAFSFENLVVGKTNSLAYAAAEGVAAKPGGTYNPLFIYGGSGLGKTHMIHAIGNHVIGKMPEKNVRYVHADDYVSSVFAAFRNHSFDALKQYYYSLDVLLFDDVQFLGSKERGQEEFFYILKTLLDARKQVILTCDTYPRNINGLSDRIVSRFDSGLVVQIDPPELDMRVAILKQKAGAEHLRLSDDGAFFIAKYLRSNVRELEGALKKVMAYCSFRNEPITLESIREALKDIINATRNVSIEDIQKTVSEYYKIKLTDLLSKKRNRPFVRPRHVAIWLCRQVTQFSLPVIGAAFDRDHTSIMSACDNIETLRVKDGVLAHDLHVLVQMFKEG